MHEQQFGVDLLYDPKCDKSSYVSPAKGIALYFASARPMVSCSHGGNWLAFWWWNAGSVWPTGESDVLGHPYGHCGPQDLYCFGRIASWAHEDSTELLAMDSHGNEYLWKFASNNPVAHAAWLAFHDHLTIPAGKVFNKSPAWNPKLLKGTKPKVCVGLSLNTRTQSNWVWCKAVLINFALCSQTVYRRINHYSRYT